MEVSEKGINFALAFGKVTSGKHPRRKTKVNRQRSRGVAQPGLEYASGGRVVASSNLVTPTEDQRKEICNAGFLFSFFSFPEIFQPREHFVCTRRKKYVILHMEMKVVISHTYEFPVPQHHESLRGVGGAMGQSREGSRIQRAHKRTDMME